MPERQPISSRGEAPSGGRIVALVLTLASGLVFGGAVFSDEALYARDVMNYYWPTRHSAAESFRAAPAAAARGPTGNRRGAGVRALRLSGRTRQRGPIDGGCGLRALGDGGGGGRSCLALARGPDRSVAGGAIAHGRSAIGGLQRAGLADDDSAFSREAAGTRGAWGRFCLGGPRCRGPAVACI